MTYLIVGTSSTYNKEINDIIAKNGVSENSIVKYDLQQQTIDDAIDDINTLNLFGEKKVIIISNINLLEESKKLENYLLNQNDNILILTDKSVDGKKKIIKRIKEKSTYVNVDEIDLTDFIKKTLSEYKIGKEEIELLKNYCSNDYERIKNEIDKLMLYKYDERKITAEDIKELVRPSYETSIFDLTNAINKKDYKEIFDIYNKLKLNGEDEIKLTSVLASNFRIMFKVKTLQLSNSDEQIMSILKISNPYRLKYLKKDASKFETNELLRYLKELSEMDIRVKKGEIDKSLAMELFLAKI